MANQGARESGMANPIESSTVPEPVAIRDIVLRDGSTLALRPGRAGDADALLQFFAQLSPQSRYQRFFGFPVLDGDRARRLLVSDAPEAMALVGEVSGRMVAFAGFYRANGQADRAEVAFAIADAIPAVASARPACKRATGRRQQRLAVSPL